MYKGWSFYLINNVIGSVTRLPVYMAFIGNTSNYKLYGLYLIGEFISYPFSTAFKRLQCQTDRFIGMIPKRYSNLYHAVKVIAFEEGGKGLWRGFGLHSVQTVVRLGML